MSWNSLLSSTILPQNHKKQKIHPSEPVLSIKQSSGTLSDYAKNKAKSNSLSSDWFNGHSVDKLVEKQIVRSKWLVNNSVNQSASPKVTQKFMVSGDWFDQEKSQADPNKCQEIDQEMLDEAAECKDLIKTPSPIRVNVNNDVIENKENTPGVSKDFNRLDAEVLSLRQRQLSENWFDHTSDRAYAARGASPHFMVRGSSSPQMVRNKSRHQGDDMKRILMGN